MRWGGERLLVRVTIANECNSERGARHGRFGNGERESVGEKAYLTPKNSNKGKKEGFA